MLSLNFINSYLLDENQKKNFKERVSYVNPKIISCKFNKDQIKIFFNKKINVIEKKKNY